MGRRRLAKYAPREDTIRQTAMRIFSLFLLHAFFLGGTAHAAGLLSKLIWGGDSARTPLFSRGGVKMLELEVVERPAKIVAEEFAVVRFRVKQLKDPDPQFIGPPLRFRRLSLAGAQLDQQWMRPNGAGIYELSVPMREARQHYLYFETGDHKTVLARVPWVVLRSAD